ncbi:MAG: peptide ABC transporter substrate-binding protein [Chloroflexi bacterium]|nr:MAG: peptide ABC transporter substrate-binding protein [Chloroflexota bacterium]TMF35286.1 MAG: peptide ABC transporter substrate-binding protein [Chloroflexota bacterium]
MKTTGSERQLSRNAASSEPRRAATSMHANARPSHTGTNHVSVGADGVKGPHNKIGMPIASAARRAEPDRELRPRRIRCEQIPLGVEPDGEHEMARVFSLPRVRSGARLMLLMLVAAACNPNANPPPSPEPLASDQTLSFPIAQDVGDFDPALISSAADVDILRNVFSGLYRFDQRLQEVPDIAAGPPAVSDDGLRYTFHVRSDARFSNGDPITADDFIYSWNRAAAKQGDYASLFDVIAGYQAVAAGRTGQMIGLNKVDPTTFTVTLVKRAGYFVTEVGLWPFWLVDQKVVASAGEDAWFSKPETLIGSGAFRMTARTPGLSIDFEPVSGWYGGKTGQLSRVHIAVMADATAQVAQYESGVLSLIGYGRQALPPAAAARYTTDSRLRGQLALVPLGTTFWAGFNLKTGPFAGIDAGRAGRHAFSIAIDRKTLVDAVCNEKTTCEAASGGVVSKGLAGYLGDGQDHNFKFDAKAARAEYTAWDPSGVKVKGLSYTYDANPFNKAVCTNLQQQWKKNLGVDVGCVEMDRKTFFDQRNGACAYPMFRQSWAADYDHPQDWFDYLFVSGASSSGSCYSNPDLDKLVASADQVPLAQGLIDYKTSGALLVNDSVFAPLVYGVQQYLVHPYVVGAGGNALYDNYWTSVRILKH